jgi:starch phosphorylase
VRAAWPRVSIRRLSAPPQRIAFGERVRLEAAVGLSGLAARDVTVEVVFDGRHGGDHRSVQRMALTPDDAPQADGTVRYALDLAPDGCGKLDYRIRAYPSHPLLTHPFELGLMIWI